MEKCPPELLHLICALLRPRDILPLRLVNQSLAAVGAHYLVSKVTFHSSPQSLQRLETISQHTVFRYYVTTLRYEATLLDYIPSAEEYNQVRQSQYARVNDDVEPPTPNPHASAREWRLYRRNSTKWLAGGSQPLSLRALNKEYQAYNRIYDRQQNVVEQRLDYEILAKAIPQFPRLAVIELSNNGTCRDGYSKRFQDQFSYYRGNISPEFRFDSAETSGQVRSMLFALAGSSTAVRSMHLEAVSPSLFCEYSPGSTFDCMSALSGSLKELSLLFRLEDTMATMARGFGQMVGLDPSELGSWSYQVLKRGQLARLSSKLPILEVLSVGFDDKEYSGPCLNLKHVLGDCTWPHLKELVLQTMTADPRRLLNSLERQPCLERLTLANFTLSGGHWRDVLDEIRHHLNLKSAFFEGFLDTASGSEYWDMDHVNVDSYRWWWEDAKDDEVFMNLSMDIDMYLTFEKNEEGFNPLESPEEYMDMDELHDLIQVYG